MFREKVKMNYDDFLYKNDIQIYFVRVIQRLILTNDMNKSNFKIQEIQIKKYLRKTSSFKNPEN